MRSARHCKWGARIATVHGQTGYDPVGTNTLCDRSFRRQGGPHLAASGGTHRPLGAGGVVERCAQGSRGPGHQAPGPP